MRLKKLRGRTAGASGGGRRPYFRINLSRRFRPYVAPVRFVLVLCCWVFFGAIIWDVSRSMVELRQVWAIRAELERLRHQDQQLIAEMQQEGLDVSDAMFKQLPEEVELANRLLEKRTFSWTAFLTGLEEAMPPRLAINSVRMEAGTSIVHLTGKAGRMEDVTAMTLKLQDNALFKDPVLAHHRVDTNGLVEFDVTFKYQPRRA